MMTPKKNLQNPTNFSPPTDLDFEKAMMFFHAYMYGPLQGKLRLYEARKVHAAGKIHPSDWEVFASILVKDLGRKLLKGVDLANYEVKSAENAGSFEYQYHKDTGLEKLREDMEKAHLFFSHRENLKQVDLRFIHGTVLKPTFIKWLKEYPDPYPQRYRKSISFGFVKEHGQLLMAIEDGEITFPRMKS